MIRKKIKLDANHLRKLTELLKSSSASESDESELDKLDESLSQEIITMLKKSQNSMTEKDGNDGKDDEKNIDANWAAIKARIDGMEKVSDNPQADAKPAEVLSLTDARMKRLEEAAAEKPAAKKRRILPFSVITLFVAAAAITLYIMPGTQPNADTNNLGIKGTGGPSVPVCTFELRSDFSSYPLEGEATLVNSSEKMAIVTKCPEAQVLHLQITAKGMVPVRSLNNSIKTSTSQMVFPVGDRSELLQLAAESSAVIEIISTSVVIPGGDVNFEQPGVQVNWHLSYIVNAE